MWLAVGSDYVFRGGSNELSSGMLFGTSIIALGVSQLLKPVSLQWLFRWEAPAREIKQVGPDWLSNALAGVMALGLLGSFIV